MKLVKKTECWRLTWLGRLLVIFTFLLLLIVLIKGLYPFLATHQPLSKSDLLVVDGPLPDHAMQLVVEEFIKGNYNQVVTLGGPITYAINQTEHQTVADFVAAGLILKGLDSTVVAAVPRGYVKTDRTYENAKELHNWLQQSHGTISSLNVVSMGPHSRRSRLLFKKAFGKYPETDNNLEIGVISMEDIDYDGSKWWKSSVGFRTVIGELVAYLYARFFFYP